VNPEVAQALEEAGLRFVGKDDTGKRVEVIEYEIRKNTISHSLSIQNPFLFVSTGD
jgi:CTP synthase (UTP-ammonia lyase)